MRRTWRGEEKKTGKGKLGEDRSAAFPEPPGDLAEDVPGGKRLGEASVHAGLPAEGKGPVPIMAREAEKEGARIIHRRQVPDGPGGFQSVQDGHFQVEKDHVGNLPFRQLQGFFSV